MNVLTYMLLEVIKYSGLSEKFHIRFNHTIDWVNTYIYSLILVMHRVKGTWTGQGREIFIHIHLNYIVLPSWELFISDAIYPWDIKTSCLLIAFEEILLNRFLSVVRTT